jgi:hypothetical protein
MAVACLWAPGLHASWLPLRIGAAVLVSDLTLVWTLGHDPRTHVTLEAQLRHWLLAKPRPTGGSPFPPMASPSAPPSPISIGAAERRADADNPRSLESSRGGAPLEISPLVILQAISYAALALLIAWLVTGGAQEVVRWWQAH